MAKARANGHPTIPPVAKSNVADTVRRLFWLLGGAIAYENANVLVYMANEEGRRAMPQLRFKCG